MLEVNRNDTLQLAPDVVLHAIPELEKYWAFRIEAGDHYELNESAFFLLSLFREPKKVGTAFEAYASKFDQDMVTIERDCLPLIAQYFEEALFERRK